MNSVQKYAQRVLGNLNPKAVTSKTTAEEIEAMFMGLPKELVPPDFETRFFEAKERDRKTEEFKKEEKKRQDKFLMEQAALLDAIPEPFREFVARLAYAERHSNGYDEVLSFISDILDEYGLAEAIKEYERLRSE